MKLTQFVLAAVVTSVLGMNVHAQTAEDTTAPGTATAPAPAPKAPKMEKKAKSHAHKAKKKSHVK